MQTSHIYDIPGTDLSLPYLLYRPDAGAACDLPLIVFLHGGGERGTDPELLKCHSLPMLCETGIAVPALVLSPQCADGKDWYYYMPYLMEFIIEIGRKYKADMSRVSLTGISMGGYGVWELAQLYPEAFHALAPICGGGMPFMADRYLKTKIWAFHGEEDDVVPVNETIQMVNAVKKAEGNATMTIYKHTGHHSWVPAYNDPRLLEWLTV